MRTGPVLAGLVLTMGGLAGCGGDDEGGSAPADASLGEFCETFDGLFEQVLSEDVAGDQAAMVRALTDWATEMEEVGTPSDIPEDARRGFELFLAQARAIDEDASLADLRKLGEDLNESDRADADAFSDWAQESCPLDVPALPGSSP